MFLNILVKNLNQSIFRYSNVLDYLKSRKITEEDIKKYHIGFNKVINIVEDIKDPDWLSFKDSCNGGRKFENKIVFPLKDVFGNVIGIIGRSIENKEFKIFVRERFKFEGFFFGLYDAMPYIYEKNRVYLVEGPFDYLAFSKVVPNTLATLTARITDAQYDFLTMFCDSIVTVFDSDRAGDIGREKAAKKDKKIKSIYLGYKDPASLFEELDFEKFKSFILKKISNII